MLLGLWAVEKKLEVLDRAVGDIGTMIVGDAGGRILHVFHQTIEIIARVRNTDYAYRGAIPEFCSIQLSNRQVEARAQAILQAADYLPSVLQRLRGFDVEFECEESDGHYGRWSFVVSRWPKQPGQPTHD